MFDPTIATLDPTRFVPGIVADILSDAAKTVSRGVPPRYRDAVAEVREVREWVAELIEQARSYPGLYPTVGTGPSLLLIGPVGTGKTHQAYGAVRALAASGARCGWKVLTAADVYARLRPRPGVDSEQEFDQIAAVGLLVLDDLGAAKQTDWTEEVNYRLVNRRYEACKPTLVTSNVPPKDLADVLGQRVASRLREMCRLVVLKGDDRRSPR